MKIQKFNEKFIGFPYKDVEDELELNILDIIENEVETQYVPYSSDDSIEISGRSREKAAKEIVKYLIENLTPEIIKDIQVKQASKKYNL